jgi:hypothetical protein
MGKIQHAALVEVKIYLHATAVGISRREMYDDGTISTLEMKNGKEYRWIHCGDPERIMSRITRR